MTGYLAINPPTPLSAFVQTLWTAERPAGLPHAREWNLPTGRADLVLPLHSHRLRRFDGPGDAQGHWLAGGVLQGAMDAPCLRDTAGASVVVGAHFHAHGLTGLLAVPAGELADRAWALDGLWPGWADRLRDQILNDGALHQPQRRLVWLARALTARLRLAAPADALVPWALAQLDQGLPVGQVQRASGCSPTTFVRRFRDAVGLTPQRHLALQRFGTALRLGHQGEAWASVAAQAGFADQAHLSRELRRFAGHSPSRMRAAATAWPQHLACG